MIRASKVGTLHLRVFARNSGEAVTLARVLNTAEQARTIGPRPEKGGGASLLITYASKAARDAAALAARAAPTFTPVSDVPEREPTIDELEGEHTMATRTTTTKRPKRGAPKATAKKKAAAAKRTTKAKKKAAGLRKKAAALRKRAAAKPKKKAAKKAGSAMVARRGRPPGGGVGELVKQMLRDGATEAAIIKAVTAKFPDSAMVEKPTAQLAWYRHRVKREDAEKAAG